MVPPRDPLLSSQPKLRLVATVAAVLAAACSDAPAAPGVPGEPVATVRGRLHAPGVSTFQDLTAHLRWGDASETTEVAADGTFAIPLHAEVSGLGALTIEPADGAGLHPAYVVLTSDDLDRRSDVVMVPRRWTVRQGDYAGTEVPIDPDLAADTRVLPSFWGFYYPFQQDGFQQVVTDSVTWSADLRSWPRGSFPIGLVLDRPGSDARVTVADSAALWRHVATLEAALGRDVFQPASPEDAPSRAVLIRIDTEQAVDGFGEPADPDFWSWRLSVEGGAWSGGRVERLQVGSTDMRGAVVTLRAPYLLRDQRTVIHELMHVLGAGHGCSWASVQTYCAALATDVPTPADVAHLEVLEAVRHLEGISGSRWGLLASVLGHRAVTLGLSPVPQPDLVYGPDPAGPGAGQ